MEPSIEMDKGDIKTSLNSCKYMVLPCENNNYKNNYFKNYTQQFLSPKLLFEKLKLSCFQNREWESQKF